MIHYATRKINEEPERLRICREAVREEGMIALAEYNKNPYSVSDRGMTFSQIYEKFYKNKYEY